MASPVPEADLSFTSPPASGSQSRVQPDPPGRKHSTTVDTTASKTQPQVKRAVRDFKSKYAAQDPLEDALQQQAPASPAKVNNKRKAVISAPQASDGGKRRKKVVEEDADDEEDGDEEFTQPQRPASASPQKKSKAGALTSVTFDFIVLSSIIYLINVLGYEAVCRRRDKVALIHEARPSMDPSSMILHRVLRCNCYVTRLLRYVLLHFS